MSGSCGESDNSRVPERAAIPQFTLKIFAPAPYPAAARKRAMMEGPRGDRADPASQSRDIDGTGTERHAPTAPALEPASDGDGARPPQPLAQSAYPAGKTIYVHRHAALGEDSVS